MTVKFALMLAALFSLPALSGCATPAEASPYYNCYGKLIRKNQPCLPPAPTPTPTPVPTPLPIVSVVSTSVNENAGTVSVHVTRTGSLTAQSSLHYTTQDVTATTGINYQTTFGSLIFAPSQSDASFSVPILDDGKVQGNLIFNVLLTDISGATLGLNGIVTIINTDVPPPATQTCPDGSVIPATSVCPVPPVPVPAPAPGTVIALQACQSLMNPNDALIIGATYIVVGTAALEPAGGIENPVNVTAKDVDILNDATHHGDGWFALWVPIGCVSTS